LKPIWIRAAKSSEAELFTKWTIDNIEKNHIDPDILGYPSTRILCAYDKDGPIAFMPAQLPVMMESLAFRPGITNHEAAAALKAFLQEVISSCYETGVGEIYFLSSEPTVAKMAERYGFEKLELTAYRLKVKNT
jgi:hypothetical protein